jgi:two-component system sensor histidine kinase KdpD
MQAWRHTWQVGIAVSILSTGLLVLALLPFRDDIGFENAGFLFLALTLLIASYWGRAVGVFEAVLANLAFNFFFIEPRYHFFVDEPRHVFALFIFLVVSIVGA